MEIVKTWETFCFVCGIHIVYFNPKTTSADKYVARVMGATQNLAQTRKGKKTPGKDFNKSA